MKDDFRRPPTLKVSFDCPWKQPMGIDTSIASIGSCFAQELAGALLEAGFKGAQNPNGIMYNAVSMADAMERSAFGPEYGRNDFFESYGTWHSWLHHGAFSSVSLDEAVEKAETSRIRFAEALKSCDLFIATPSSSAVYELQPEGLIVANCHKEPGTRFKRRILSVEENFAALERVMKAARHASPSCKTVITLSPVRHYPGDLVLNARSKAHLLTAIHQACESNPDTIYFPAYEIVLDELRDYRFFKEDMVHPNGIATEMVMKSFASACLGEDSIALLGKALRARKTSVHRPLQES